MTAKALLLLLLAPLFGGTLMASFAMAEGSMKGADFLRVVPDQMHQLQIVKADLPAEEAAANVTQLKRMLSRKDKENARAEVPKMPIAATGRSD